MMPNKDGTKTVKISEKTYKRFDRFNKKRNYKVGGFIDKAINAAIDAELQRDKSGLPSDSQTL